MMRVPRSLHPLPLLVLLPFGLSAQDPGDPPGRVGRISSLLGTVSFQAAGLGDWSLASLNYTVTTGDRLFTSQHARAEMEVGPFAVRLADTTDLSVVNLTDHFMQLGVTQGTIRVSVYRISASDSMEVDTPNGALIIRSPGQYRVDIPLNGKSTIVSVDDGTLELNGPGLDQRLTRGQTVELTGSAQIRAAFATRPRDTDFDLWSADRDRRQEASDCSRYVSRDIPGCADLSDHGRWDEHPVYGPVWYPSHVPVGWVPYRYGRWVWVEPWGWTWVEDEPWGFAPFHYGRWIMVGAFWVWAPGPILRQPCYAPAFVTFVGGPRYGWGVNIGVHAWFPLGPREPYFPWYHHGARYLREVNYANVRNVTNINIFVDNRRADYINYANRGGATTVVSTETFRHGRPVGHDVVQVPGDEISRAPIARSPWVTPSGNAAAGGRRETPEPVAARPRIVTAWNEPNATPEHGTSGTDARPRERPPLVSRNPQSAEGGQAVTPTPRQSGDPSPRARPRDERELISRTAPPPQTPPFDARERVMRQNPGRPLDPQQMETIRQQRSAEARPSAPHASGTQSRGRRPPG